MDPHDLSLGSDTIGPLPIARHFFERLDLDRLLETYVPGRRLGREPELGQGKAIGILVTNVLLSREPLYAIPEWVERHAADCLGFVPGQAARFNDDRIGRALDRLFETDPASMMTALMTRAVKEFEIDLEQIHNDTTTVTFSGAYEGQKNPEEEKRPPWITFGHNKDHRPDLKQLVYSLSVSADGAVPIHYKCYDGNQTDDQTHIETWKTVRRLAGTSSFMYVADSKLCTGENMKFIHGEKGRFLTVLPRSRKEDDDFRVHVQENTVVWEEVRRRRSRRGSTKPDEVYRAFAGAPRSAEGYRIVWYKSSVKEALDQKRRTHRIKRARQRLTQLEQRKGPHRFRTVETAESAATKVLVEEGATQWLRVKIHCQEVSDLKQVQPGRPGKNTTYRKIPIPVILFDVEEDGEAIQRDARCDGLFAMVTNDERLSPKELLDIYKYQPFLEKRNEQLKSVLDVAPVFLKKPERVAALLFVYFLAMLVMALIERELRLRMKDARIDSLPLYPESRLCKAPTTEVMFRAFEGIRRHQLIDRDGQVLRTFHDPLSPVAREVLALLSVDPTPYER